MSPQASKELRERWDGPDDQKALRFLEDCGYVLTSCFEWRKPSPEHEPTEEELSAMAFMVEEWDYGWTVKP